MVCAEHEDLKFEEAAAMKKAAMSDSLEMLAET